MIAGPDKLRAGTVLANRRVGLGSSLPPCNGESQGILTTVGGRATHPCQSTQVSPAVRRPRGVKSTVGEGAGCSCAQYPSRLLLWAWRRFVSFATLPPYRRRLPLVLLARLAPLAPANTSPQTSLAKSTQSSDLEYSKYSVSHSFTTFSASRPDQRLRTYTPLIPSTARAQLQALANTP